MLLNNWISWSDLIDREEATLAGNIPALVEALLYCARKPRGETPAWVTRYSRDLIIDLLLQKKLSPSGLGAKHLDRCRLDMIHARRHQVLQEIRDNKPTILAEKNHLRERTRTRRKRHRHVPESLRNLAAEKENRAKAISRQCEAAARLLRVQGDLLVSPAAVLRSFRLVEQNFGRFYYPTNTHVLRALRLPDVFSPKPHDPNWEKALLDKPYQRAPTGSGAVPATRAVSARIMSRPILSVDRAPWDLDEPTLSDWNASTPDSMMRLAVQAGNHIALLNELHRYNRSGGHAPAWLMKGAARAIIQLLMRKPRRGRLSKPLDSCRQQLVNCERYLLIVNVWLVRSANAAVLKATYMRKPKNARAAQRALSAMGLLHGKSIEAAIRESMRIARPEVHATFATAKKAFWAVRNEPLQLRQHCRPCDFVAKALGLPTFGG